LSKLLKSVPPLADKHILAAIEIFTKDHQYHGCKDEVAKMWERAALVSSKDESFFSVWFEITFANEDYKSAQKASLLWSRAYPQKREPFVWSIVCNFLASTDSAVATKDRELCGMLAFRTLARAAADVPIDKRIPNLQSLSLSDKASYSKALATTEELLFTLKVYRHQGKNREALMLLEDSNRTGLNSELGKGSWDVLIHKVELLAICEHWEELFQLSRNILEQALPDYVPRTGDSVLEVFGDRGDDLCIWRAFVEACVKLDKPEMSDRFRVLLGKVKDYQSKNAWYAGIYFQVLAPQTAGAFLDSMKDYYNKYKSHDSCYVDIGIWAEKLSDTELESFLGEVSKTLGEFHNLGKEVTSKQIAGVTTALKLKYTLSISRNIGEGSEHHFRTFATECLRFYQTSLALDDAGRVVTDRHQGDGIAMLAAMACVRLGHLGVKNAILQAYTILCLASSLSKHNEDILVLLICLCKMIGAGSIVMEHYAKLDLKNIQYFTTTWIALERVSTLHPHAFVSQSKVNDPLQELLTASKKTTNFVRDALVSRLEAFESGALSAVVEASELGNTMKYSNTRMTQACELTRILAIRPNLNLLSTNPDSSAMSFASVWEALEGSAVEGVQQLKSSEITSVPSFEGCATHFHDYLATGPAASNSWYNFQVETARAYSTLFFGGNAKPDDVQASISAKDIDTEGQTVGLTPAEHDMKNIVGYINSQLSKLGSKNTMTKSVVDELTEFLKGAAKIRIEATLAFSRVIASLDLATIYSATSTNVFAPEMDSIYPNWKFFHMLYVHIELVRLIIGFFKHCLEANKKNKVTGADWLKEDLKSFEATALQIRKNIEKGCKAWQAKLSNTETCMALVKKIKGLDEEGNSDELGTALAETFDDIKLSETALNLLLSWNNALDGHKAVTYA
jgi:hypothetical protein